MVSGGERLSAWFGAGVLTVGVSAGLLAAAGAASADTGSAGSAGSSSSSHRTAAKKEHSSKKPPAAHGRAKRRADVPAAQAADVKPRGRATAVRAATVASNAVVPATSTHAMSVQRPVPVPRPTGLPAVATFVGNLVFGTITLLEQAVMGPPALPAGSTVTVRTSTLNVAGGYPASANWYFPDTDTPPTKMILLQHGLLATGPMYSYTAANLAEQTGAIVVAPTLVSNLLAGDGLWLGGDAMSRSVANLFIGDRKELTSSALAAGYAAQYGLSTEDAVLPEQFALVGHSLGGALVSGVAGYLAVNGGADNLVGVILLDGVPTRNIMSDALTRLADYQLQTGRNIPVRQIAAPPNSWNASSTANADLNALRPDTYNGVILDGGVHMDSMQGGNQLIQFLAYLFAGFPTEVNQIAVQDIAIQWLGAWFSGAPEDEPELGSTIVIPTPAGDAHAVVIGAPAAQTVTISV